jgi:hypothetical protein
MITIIKLQWIDIIIFHIIYLQAIIIIINKFHIKQSIIHVIYQWINIIHYHIVKVYIIFYTINYIDTISIPRSPHSQLSSYGTNSLTVNVNQNDIYNKQNHKFNIITNKPKDFNTAIRQFPSYTL